MKRKNKKFQRKSTNSLNKLSLFQKSDGKFSRKCPLSVKNAPIIDYKNISLLRKYTSDNGKIISQKSFFISTKDDEEKLKNKTQKLEYLVFPESIIKIFQNN